MSKWQIDLEGNDYDIKVLESLLADSPYQIDTWEGEKLLSLSGIASEADPETVYTASSQLVDIINGAAKLYYKKFHGVSFNKVSRMKKDGKRIVYGYLDAHARDFTILSINPNDKTLSSWIDTAFDEPEIARALYLFGVLESNWKNLYMVLVVIENDFGDESFLLDANLVSKNDIKLFKRTANSYKSIGRDARHGKLNFEPPPSPMKLEKAYELISALLKGWIKYKQNKST
jgi:hypothetical protein